nr:MAG TPA: hypothetical protein [Caudoviricetes sp.]
MCSVIKIIKHNRITPTINCKNIGKLPGEYPKTFYLKFLKSSDIICIAKLHMYRCKVCAILFSTPILNFPESVDRQIIGFFFVCEFNISPF